MATPLEKIIQQLEAEKKRLDHEFKVELPKAIGIARAHGDLSENAEYHAARERHAFVKARIGQIDQQLARLTNIDLRQVPRDRVGIYSRVEVFEFETDEDHEFQLVTPEESDLAKGLISMSSPIGRGLMNRREGDEVEIEVPSGTRTFEITGLTTLHDLAQAGDDSEE